MKGIHSLSINKLLLITTSSLSKTTISEVAEVKIFFTPPANPNLVLLLIIFILESLIDFARETVLSLLASENKIIFLITTVLQHCLVSAFNNLTIFISAL